MNNACLHDGLLPDGADRVRQALQAVADQQAHIARAAVLDLRQHPQPVLGALAVAVLAGPQPQDVPLAVHGDAQRQVDGPVSDLPLTDLHLDGIDEEHRIDRVQRPVLPVRQALHHPLGDRGDRLLGHLGAIDLAQVRDDFPVRQPLRGQGNHHLVDAGQPPLPFRDDSRLETGVPVPRHADFHRPGVSEHGLRAAAVTGIAAIPARRVVLRISQVIVQLAFQRALDHHLGQLAQQAALAGQLQPAVPRPLGKLAQQLLISRRQLRRLPVDRHVSHWCLLHLRSYTVEITVPCRQGWARRRCRARPAGCRRRPGRRTRSAAWCQTRDRGPGQLPCIPGLPGDSPGDEDPLVITSGRRGRAGEGGARRRAAAVAPCGPGRAAPGCS
jgi:hypothetical protein